MERLGLADDRRGGARRGHPLQHAGRGRRARGGPPRDRAMTAAGRAAPPRGGREPATAATGRVAAWARGAGDDVVPSLVSFGPEECADLDAGLGREWLVTNGLGGYAFGTVAGAPTRAYHGLLVAAMTPPVGRTALVGGLLESATMGGRTYDLSTLSLSTGAVAPAGHRHLAGFRLDGMLPAWLFTAGGAILERRVWMAYGRNTTFVRWTVLEAPGPVSISATVLVTEREHHDPVTVDLRRPVADADGPGRVVVRMAPDGIPIRIGASATGGAVSTIVGCCCRRPGRWRRRGPSRGGPATTRRVGGSAGSACAWNPSAGSRTSPTSSRRRPPTPCWIRGHRSTSCSRRRPAAILRRRPRSRQRATASGRSSCSPARGRRSARPPSRPRGRPVRRRASPVDGRVGRGRRRDGADDRTVIAGYPWFADWGRDTMIALPGLCLATGRGDDAARILRGFARYVRDGLIPNDFPDVTGVVPGYHTADASLWFIHTVAAYERATGDDRRLADDLLPTLRAIVDAHVVGTRFGIGVDPADGLLRAGEPGYQLTWMDAKAGEWVVTPRMGKPVEIQALWHEALRDLAEATEARGDRRPPPRTARWRTASGRRSGHGSRDLASITCSTWWTGPTATRTGSGPTSSSPSRSRTRSSTATWPAGWSGRSIGTCACDSVCARSRPTTRVRRCAARRPRHARRRVPRGHGMDVARRGLRGGDVACDGRRGPGARSRPGDGRPPVGGGPGVDLRVPRRGPPHAPRACTHQAWGVSETLRILRLLGA